jgi:hypothetical protein
MLSLPTRTRTLPANLPMPQRTTFAHPRLLPSPGHPPGGPAAARRQQSTRRPRPRRSHPRLPSRPFPPLPPPPSASAPHRCSRSSAAGRRTRRRRARRGSACATRRMWMARRTPRPASRMHRTRLRPRRARSSARSSSRASALAIEPSAIVRDGAALHKAKLTSLLVLYFFARASVLARSCSYCTTAQSSSTSFRSTLLVRLSYIHVPLHGP